MASTIPCLCKLPARSGGEQKSGTLGGGQSVRQRWAVGGDIGKLPDGCLVGRSSETTSQRGLVC